MKFDLTKTGAGDGLTHAQMATLRGIAEDDFLQFDPSHLKDLRRLGYADSRLLPASEREASRVPVAARGRGAGPAAMYEHRATSQGLLRLLAWEFGGMAVAAAAAKIMDGLEPGDLEYAGDPERGEYRGFAALHDLCDANMLLPFVDEAYEAQAEVDGDDEDQADDRPLVDSHVYWSNAISDEVGRRIRAEWDRLHAGEGAAAP